MSLPAHIASSPWIRGGFAPGSDRSFVDEVLRRRNFTFGLREEVKVFFLILRYDVEAPDHLQRNWKRLPRLTDDYLDRAGFDDNRKPVRPSTRDRQLNPLYR